MKKITALFCHRESVDDIYAKCEGLASIILGESLYFGIISPKVKNNIVPMLKAFIDRGAQYPISEGVPECVGFSVEGFRCFKDNQWETFNQSGQVKMLTDTYLKSVKGERDKLKQMQTFLREIKLEARPISTGRPPVIGDNVKNKEIIDEMIKKEGVISHFINMNRANYQWIFKAISDHIQDNPGYYILLLEEAPEKDAHAIALMNDVSREAPNKYGILENDLGLKWGGLDTILAYIKTSVLLMELGERHFIMKYNLLQLCGR